MKRTEISVRAEMRTAKQTWLDVGVTRLKDLRCLLVKYKFSVARGEITLIDNRWYVTHAGLLHLAARQHCRGISTSLQRQFCDPVASRWVFRAVVYKRANSKGFVGYGDADPSNVSSLVQGAEMRVAETRAVNRALRKAYGIGLCSIEELGSRGGSFTAAATYERATKPQPQNGSKNAQPRLKDKLCLLIQQYNLNSGLVKAYAADFCGTETLSGATRELVESFILHLETQARENRDSLICKLNSYARPEEVRS